MRACVDDHVEPEDDTKPATDQQQQSNDAALHKTRDVSRCVRRRSDAPCRSKKSCPVSTCGVGVIHLPRHLREKQQLKHAVHALQLYNLRKQMTRRAVKQYKDYHKRRHCPFDGCHAVVKRLSAHLLQCHKLM